MRGITSGIRRKIKAQLAKGRSIRQVAKRLNLQSSTVAKLKIKGVE